MHATLRTLPNFLRVHRCPRMHAVFNGSLAVTAVSARVQALLVLGRLRLQQGRRYLWLHERGAGLAARQLPDLLRARSAATRCPAATLASAAHPATALAAATLAV